MKDLNRTGKPSAKGSVEYRIHGDNIVECRRTLSLICSALGISSPITMVPTGSPLAPRFKLKATADECDREVVLLPGYGRWSPDILEIIRDSGACLREAADSIVSRVHEGCEDILLAIEFCGALPAGNQAWQRNGRAFSFAKAGIPYIYIAELSGFELGPDRKPKAARLPNPAVPFSYLLLSKAVGSPTMPVFVRSPGAAPEAVAAHGPFYGEKELVEIVRHTLVGTSPALAFRALETKLLGLVCFLAATRKKADTLPPKAWEQALAAVDSGDTLVEYIIAKAGMKWSKTTSIAGLTRSAERLMASTAKLAVGLTCSSLPMCIVPTARRRSFADMVRKLYPDISEEFVSWCCQDNDLAIVWLNGFKPKGDDARPDRGLAPLCRMLVGEKTDVLTVVFGPAPSVTWPLLVKSPTELMRRNGLWQSILTCSDAVLADSSTVPNGKPIAVIPDRDSILETNADRRSFLVHPAPERVGEHDVDTVLHLLVAGLGQDDVFEGLCNPPGGDWSGISLLTEDRRTELRWLTLPRVTAEHAKRPDHVFQLFGPFNPPHVLAIESKETPRTVETDIGPMLRKYTEELVSTPPSVQRLVGGSWTGYCSSTPIPKPVFVTAAACIADDLDTVRHVGARANVDLVFGVRFPEGHFSCEVLLLSCSKVGMKVANFISQLQIESLALKVHVA